MTIFKKKITIVFWFILVMVFVAFVVGFYFRGTGQGENFGREQSLRAFYEKVFKLSKDRDFAALYDEQLPALKQYISKDRFIEFSSREGGPRPYSEEYLINGISIQDNIGLVDRTYVACNTKECKPGKDKITSRLIKTYVFSDGRWYSLGLLESAEQIGLPTRYPIICNRTSPYPLSPEFNRAISLIQQRSSNVDQLLSPDARGIERFSVKIDQIYNCLDLQYALTEDSLGGAEGIFRLSANSTPERLEILVSPSYKASDDLLTATLLAHELVHAYNFAYGQMKKSLNDLNDITCFEDEAEAFTFEYLFYSTLNKEEQQSITSRYSSQSQNVAKFIETTLAISSFRGDTYYDKALAFVQTSPFYQRQCAEN